MITARQKLSIGSPPAQKALGVVFGAFFAAAGAAFALLPFVVDGWLRNAFRADESCPTASEISGIPPELLPPSVRECVSNGSWFNDGAGFGPMRLIGLMGIPFLLVGLYLALSALRTAAWLEGTKATVRGALRTRTVDLATATVTAGARTYRRNRETTREFTERVPTLTAKDPSGTSVTIPLHGVGMAQLPSAELRALADAMTANQDRDARSVAIQLRTMADNPLGLSSR
ncbi:hypothetical protein [Actinoplanes sp. ATCC 53533]|uniref:hypothetical protein n=1 Tax=Actinoplanes sp. ATCC 53533 TaxID=1288362 RepID=UPI000F77B468|nr:hypothetical protein [Actinoplanes sp. ATCC 53533]